MRAVLGSITALAMLLAPYAAEAQAWKEYSYPQDGFAVQFPAAPAESATTYKTQAGMSLPAVTYSVQQDNIVYSVTVADFSKAGLDDQAAMNDAIKALSQTGEIKIDTTERIDRNYGHDITLVGKDGSRSALAVFFANQQLYELTGKALPPNAEAGSGKTARFQQTLVFIDRTGRAPRRPDDGGPQTGLGGGGPPGPGPGGRRGPPPPQAFADCRGKAEGDAVQHTTPEGVVAATCIQTPQGLAARPNAPRF
jgi:hypothetical protein